jgi:hypothetical protein
MTTIYEQIEDIETYIKTIYKRDYFIFGDFMLLNDTWKYDIFEEMLKYLVINPEGKVLPLTPFLYNYLYSIKHNHYEIEDANYHTLNGLSLIFNQIPRKTENKNGMNYIIK